MHKKDTKNPVVVKISGTEVGVLVDDTFDVVIGSMLGDNKLHAMCFGGGSIKDHVDLVSFSAYQVALNITKNIAEQADKQELLFHFCQEVTTAIWRARKDIEKEKEVAKDGDGSGKILRLC